MGICLELQAEIDQDVANSIALSGISISEFLTAPGPETDWPKNLEYFRRDKGGL